MFGEAEITEGEKVLKIENTASAAVYIKEIKLTSLALIEKRAAMAKISRPYKMSFLSCIIQTENFDAGVSEVAYFDKDINNTGGQHRVDVPVDIYKEDSVCYVNMVTDEWLTYTIKSEKSGNYDLMMNLSDSMGGSKIRIFMMGIKF